MNPLYSIVAFVLAVLLVIWQIRIWRFRVFLSPGFYFGFIWGIAFLGITIMHMGGILLEDFPQYIDELNIYAGFSCICFLFWTKIGRNSINIAQITIKFPEKAFRILAIVLLIAAIRELLRVNIGLTNMGDARANVHETMESRSVIIGYAISSSMALSILAGYRLVLFLDKKVRISLIKLLFLIMPLFANLLLSIVAGGRVDFVYSFVYYIIGASLYLPLSYKAKWRVVRIALLSFIVVFYFISAVQSQRAANGSGFRSDLEVYLDSKFPILGVLYGPIKYMSETYVGYQYRRVDDVDLSNLGYGQYTFNGFINWTIPFSNQFGMGDFSIARELNIYYYNQHTYDYTRDYYYTTHSGFIPIIKDFGIYGAYVCIFILTLLSHFLFVAIQKKKFIKYCTSLFFFVIFTDYWIRMNYYGMLSNSILLKLYPFLLIDLLAFVLNDYGGNKHKTSLSVYKSHSIGAMRK